MFGEGGLMPGQYGTRSASIICLENCDCLTINKYIFRKYLSNFIKKRKPASY